MQRSGALIRRSLVWLAQKRRPQQVLTVLGMHRSGTSLLTGTLQEAGLVLGDVVTAAPHNRKGNRESLPIRTLHDDLMQRAGGDWDRPPEQVTWQPVHNALRDAVIASHATDRFWGFKDPRTLFCLEGWLDVLPQLQMVAIVRHPEAVARSLQARNGMPLADGLELWRLYNSRLLHWLEREPALPLLHFDDDLNRFCRDVAALIPSLNLPRRLRADALRFPDAALQHQKAGAESLPPPVEGLYRQLLERRFNPCSPQETPGSPDL